MRYLKLILHMCMKMNHSHNPSAPPSSSHPKNLLRKKAGYTPLRRRHPSYKTSFDVHILAIFSILFPNKKRWDCNHKQYLHDEKLNVSERERKEVMQKPAVFVYIYCIYIYAVYTTNTTCVYMSKTLILV